MKAKISEYHQRRRWCMLKRFHYIINCQKMRRNMPCSLMSPVVTWEGIRGGRLSFGALLSEWKSELSQFAEVKAVDIAKQKNWLKYKYQGGLVGGLYHTLTNSQRQMPCAYNGSNHRTAGRILCPIPPSEILIWILKRKSCGDMASQTELNQKTGLISETTL